ncbi:hypothetical protein [Nocardia sp. 348MFTsu5.1]|uniref:TPR repeat region-containing protein n=1 Tax=Nocardia sp. 348MFTsu5.1 TaxID=1172185 RepID=UPI00039F9AA1|nr:hypothetical protein [Nocardia sp. 348MFTsu5.1]
MSGFDFGNMPTAAGGATTIGDQVEADGLNIQSTITGMDWSGAFRNAAVSRANREQVQFTRVDDAFEELSKAITDGHTSMSHISESLKTGADGWEETGYDVAEDWTVTDRYNYALAESMYKDDDAALELLANMKSVRANNAATATSQLQRLAVEFDEADTKCAAAIGTASSSISTLTPLESALGGGVADQIGEKLRNGEQLSDFERRVLEAGTNLDPDELDALKNGKSATMTQGEFDFIKEIVGDLDGLSMEEIIKLGAGAHHNEIQNNLANATQLLGIPNLSTSNGDRGGMAALPENVRKVLTTNPVDDSGTIYSHFPDSMSFVDFVAAGDQNARYGSDVNRGLLKQSSEISGAHDTFSPGSLDTIDEVLNTAMKVGGSDRIAAHDFITGENMDVTCDNGGKYNAGIHLNNISEYEWTDFSGLHTVFDTIGQDVGSSNPFYAEMSRENASSLAHYLGSPGDMGTNDDVGITNPELARIYANALSPYIGDFTGIDATSTGAPTYGADRLDPGELENIFRSLNTDGEAAATMNSEAYKWQNLMALQYGVTDQAHFSELAGILSQAMTDGNSQAVNHLSETDLAERTASYDSKMTLFSTVKDLTGLLPVGSEAGIAMQQPLADAIFGEAPVLEDVSKQGNDPNWVAQLNDPNIRDFYELEGYMAAHPEFGHTAEFGTPPMPPEWFVDGKLDWNTVNSEKHKNAFDDWVGRMNSDWEDGFDKGTQAPDWPTDSIDGSKPENPNAPARQPR